MHTCILNLICAVSNKNIYMKNSGWTNKKYFAQISLRITNVQTNEGFFWSVHPTSKLKKLI